ncbi:MAG: NYN domain-containing protein [Oscillospiraceae bacterium]|nr:NYN domain-containing protein [Oscillospiraceae bacterium]
MKKLVVGITAHVDSGKTSLSEAMLYRSGAIQKLGRVDHKDAYLDTHELERRRGITIFSKQARFSTGELDITLLDTPGHADFSAEMERVLHVLDYAILVISGTDGVQAHTETVWRLLKRYNVPTFLFVNKMDLDGADKSRVLSDLKHSLSENCVDFTPRPGLYEDIAMCSEEALEEYMETEAVSDEHIAQLIVKRNLFPCCFGSALKLSGVEEFLTILDRYTLAPAPQQEFGAKVFKIARDAQGNRLTYMKITGGSLKVRSSVAYTDQTGETLDEKIKGIRLYSGAKFDAPETAIQGEVCAVTGLSKTYPGQGLGADANASAPMLEPVLSYRIVLPKGVDPAVMLPKLRQLEEEDPQLHIVWNEQLQQIHAQLMGEVQIEILKSLIAQRFDVDVEMDTGRIMYKETIANAVEGVGHFEPLRHYAEAHFLLEPLPNGSGLIFDSACSEDVLDRNWQRLILTHLGEKQHLGVLTGSPITDMKITLIAGRSHAKHTEGGDFRQATYRGVRQGLMQAESVLLEPMYSFRLTVPAETLGRAINDIRAMNGTFETPDSYGETVTITGTAPVALMSNYHTEVAAYSHGKGKLSCALAGYAPCHNSRQVIEEIGYDPEQDVENTPHSVFCAHGAGFTVKWNEVPEYMHLSSGLQQDKTPDAPVQPVVRTRNLDIDDKELEAIMRREFGEIKRPQYSSGRQAMQAERMQREPITKKDYIIVDGYNLIFAWEDLSELAATDLDNARQVLLDRLANYRAFRGCELVVVFDGYKVKGSKGSREDHHDVHVAYTAENETGDMYIEKLANSIGRNYRVRVVTSDGLIQLSALRSGVLRMSSKEFQSEVNSILAQIRQVIEK